MVQLFLNSDEITSDLVQGKPLGLFSLPLVVDQINGKAISQGTLGTGNL